MGSPWKEGCKGWVGWKDIDLFSKWIYINYDKSLLGERKIRQPAKDSKAYTWKDWSQSLHKVSHAASPSDRWFALLLSRWQHFTHCRPCELFFEQIYFHLHFLSSPWEKLVSSNCKWTFRLRETKVEARNWMNLLAFFLSPPAFSPVICYIASRYKLGLSWTSAIVHFNSNARRSKRGVINAWKFIVSLTRNALTDMREIKFPELNSAPRTSKHNTEPLSTLQYFSRINQIS